MTNDMTKTPEEKAREIAKQEAFNNSYDDESYRQMYDIVESSFLNGYHSRDEEVKELREALKEITNALQERCDKYGMSPIEHEVLAKAKQLLKKQ